MLRKGFSYVNKVSRGGGKSLVKSTSYLCLLFLMAFSVFVMFSQDFVNAAPRKKASVKRAGNMKKANSSSAKSKTKRAATTKASTKRAGTNKKAKTARAQSRVKKKSGTTTGATAPASNPAPSKTVDASAVCPVGTILKRKYNDESGEYTYYSAKTTECSLPEGDVVNVIVWEKSNKSNYAKTLQVRPAWVAESEASFLTCIPGYVERVVNKVKTCVSVLEICPINEIVEKSGKVYINPDTQEECMAPEKSVVKNVKGDENLLSYTLADEKAYKFECPANYYPVADSETSIKVKCEMCPSGTSSSRGASSVDDCVGGEADEEEEEESGGVMVAQVVTSQVNNDDAAALAKLRIKKVEGSADDYTCIDGWTNNWATLVLDNYYLTTDKKYCVTNSSSNNEVLLLRKSFIMDKNGKIKNVVDRNAYGKNKKGCPIKVDKYYSYLDKYSNDRIYVKLLDFATLSNNNCNFGEISAFKDFFNKIVATRSSRAPLNYCDSSRTFYLNPKFGVLKMEMTSADIDNTAVNGWTEAEYERCNGYKPVLALYYDMGNGDVKDKTFVTSCSDRNSSVYTVSDGYYMKNGDFEKLSSKNLFTYWN